MTETKIELVEMDFGPALEIESKTKLFSMPKEMGNSFTRINDYIKERHVKCSIAPYARYINIDWEYQVKAGFWANIKDMFSKTWHFYSGMTLEKAVEGDNDIHVKVFKKSKYIKAVHYGPYQNVGNLYSKMFLWAKENEYKCLPESLEFYTNDPATVKKSELETILYIPVEQN